MIFSTAFSNGLCCSRPLLHPKKQGSEVIQLLLRKGSEIKHAAESHFWRPVHWNVYKQKIINHHSKWNLKIAAISVP